MLSQQKRFRALQPSWFKYFRFKETWFKKTWQKWLGRRLPASKSTLLNQRRIFILPSRQGALFLSIVLVIFVGGINYANSLILAIAFTMISLFIITILHTYANLSGLRISAGRTENSFVGDEVHCEIVISRDSENKRSYQAISLFWQDDEHHAVEQVDLLDEQSSSVWLSLVAKQRGYLQPPRLRVESRFPLGLLTAWTSIQLDQQALVYPKPISAELRSSDSVDDFEGSQPVKGQTDFDGLRGYVPGDNPKHIAWKQYARGRGLNTKAFVDPVSEKVVLDWNQLPSWETEKRLSVLCFWVEELSKNRQPFSLVLPQQRFSEAAGEAHRLQCLEALALFGHDHSSANSMNDQVIGPSHA